MDTISANFLIKKSTRQLLLSTLPVLNSVRRDRDEIKNEYFVSDKGKSPLTGAEFIIKAIQDDNNEGLNMCGYRISVNIPACTVGNNIMLVNDWSASSQIALLLLQHWLLVQGCHPDAIHAFDLEHTEVVNATPTFLIPFESNQAANQAKRVLFNHAEAIHNYRLRNKPLSEDPVKMSGSSRNFTWYIDKPDKLIRFYVKNGRIRKGFYNFGDDLDLAKQIEASLFLEGGRYLRPEVDFGKAWFRRNGIISLTDVKNEQQQFTTMFDVIRKSLWADFEFRARKFKAIDMPKAGSTDGVLMKHYLDGGDVRQHPIVQNSHDAAKYFYDANQRARDNHRVDYRIPWQVRKGMMCDDASAYLNAQMPFVPPPALASHVFGPHTASAIIEALQSQVDAQVSVAKKAWKNISKIKQSRCFAGPKRDDDSIETSQIADLMG